jgi:hypothetical protein
MQVERRQLFARSRIAESMPMRSWRRRIVLIASASLVLLRGQPGYAAAEVKLGKDFLEGVVGKLPPVPFQKADKYHGNVHSFRLAAIDAHGRRFLVTCQIEGEFRAPVNGPITDRAARSAGTPEGWRKFRFDVKARVNIEPGADGAPRFRIEIDEAKKRELDGFSGVVAKFLGQYFDDLVSQIASGRATRLNKRLNDELLKRVGVFKEYGVFRGIDYAPAEVVLHFDLSRFKSEGIAGYVFAAEHPGTVPLYRWRHPRDGSHYYTTAPTAPDRRNSVSDGIACYVYDHVVAETVPLYRWRSVRDDLYTTTPDSEKPGRVGYRPGGIAGYIYRDPKPGTVPLYRFYDPVRHQHFYSLHPHAEFAK